MNNGSYNVQYLLLDGCEEYRTTITILYAIIFSRFHWTSTEYWFLSVYRSAKSTKVLLLVYVRASELRNF